MVPRHNSRYYSFLHNYLLAFEVNIVLPEYVTVKDGVTPKVLRVELSGDNRVIDADDANDPVRLVFIYLDSFYYHAFLKYINKVIFTNFDDPFVGFSSGFRGRKETFL